MTSELDEGQLIRQLVFLGVEHPERVAEIVKEFGIKSVMTTDRGLVDVRRGSSLGQFVVCTPKKVATATGTGYTGSRKQSPGKRNATTPTARSKTMAKAAAEPETEETEKDYTAYTDKAPTPAMVDFAKWLKDEVGLEFPSKAAEAAFDTGVRLGGTLRMEFQKSDFNREQRAARREARAADNGAGEPAAEPAEAPAPKPRGRAKAATATPKATPAKRGRGRPAATAAAPY